jgi:hypothetical protein
MIVVYSTQYSSRADLEADIAAFVQNIEQHKYTENVPAPLTNDLIEIIVRKHNCEFEWVIENADGSVTPDEPRALRKQRYINETDPLFLKACEDYEIGTEEWNKPITEWKAAKAKIRKEIPYLE